MSGCIFNSKTLGSYDFSSHLIEISNDELNISLPQAQNIIDSKSIYDFDDSEIEFYKTYLHETIHLLDCSTTHWGLNYSCRLYNYFKYETKEAFDNLLVDDTEITLHYHFKNNSTNKLNYKNIKASLQYDDDMGVYIRVHFFGYVNNYQEILNIPLSMLAILEGHAYAQEQLFHWEILEKRNDFFKLKMLENEIKEKLQQTDLAEYTCILSFIDHLFPSFSIKLKLKMCIFLCRSSLNADILTRTTIPDWLIREIFSNSPPDYVNSLRLDINRGNSTPAVFFIYLMSLAVYNETNIIIDGTDFYSYMESILLNTIYENMHFESLREISDISIDHKISLLQQNGAHLVSELANESKNYSWYSFDLREIKLPGVLLCDEYQYLYPKRRLSIDLEDYIDKTLQRAIRLDRLKNNELSRKQHLDPRVASAWLQDIKSGKNSRMMVEYSFDDEDNMEVKKYIR